MTVSLAVGMFVAVLVSGLNMTDFVGASPENPGVARSTLAQSDTSTQPGSAVDVVKQVSPAVVTVINERQVQLQNGSSSLQPVGSGTGEMSGVPDSGVTRLA